MEILVIFGLMILAVGFVLAMAFDKKGRIQTQDGPEKMNFDRVMKELKDTMEANTQLKEEIRELKEEISRLKKGE